MQVSCLLPLLVLGLNMLTDPAVAGLVVLAPPLVVVVVVVHVMAREQELLLFSRLLPLLELSLVVPLLLSLLGWLDSVPKLLPSTHTLTQALYTPQATVPPSPQPSFAPAM